MRYRVVALITLAIISCTSVAVYVFFTRSTFPDGASTPVSETYQLNNPTQSAQISATQLNKIKRNKLYFEKNLGQTQKDIAFTANTANYRLELRQHDVVVSLLENADPSKELSGNKTLKRIAIRPVNANPNAKIVGIKPQIAKSSYFLSNKTSEWIIAAPHYNTVKYRDIYPGIDLSYYGSGQEIEYDFIVSPGADSGQIRLAFDGVDEIRIAENGDAVLRFGDSELLQKRPKAYQIKNGVYQEIDVAYQLYKRKNVTDNVRFLGFKIGHYDPRSELVIDPIISYTNLLSGDIANRSTSISVDSVGNIYTLSQSYSADYRDTNTDLNACSKDCQSNLVVSKFSSDKATLQWVVVLSGSANEDGRSIVTDADQNVYIAGWTNSNDFPLYKPYDRNFEGLTEGFLAKITADGSKLAFSSYVGTARSEILTDLTLDYQGNILLSGRSSFEKFSEDDHLTNAARVDTDSFFSKFSNDGQRHFFTRYLGGSAYDSIDAITTDLHGDIYLAGTTESMDLPLFKTSDVKRDGVSDTFVARYLADGKTLVMSTLFWWERCRIGQRNCN